jgi:acyl transferase domain-containing protein
VQQAESVVLAPLPALPAERPLCVITASACSAPGGNLAPQSTKGNDRITLVPLERWDVGPPPADAASELNLQFGSFLPNVAMFDPGMFGISPAEALLMDPQQRLVMHTFSDAMAGHLLGRAAVRETGVFVGVSQLDYARTAYETGSALNTYYATGSHLSVTSGRLSYTHGFKGPALTVDTACSSSLVTTHLASRSLYEGECRVAGSIGVNLSLVHSWTRACLRAGMLAEDGHCKTMDASAGKNIN